MQGMPEQQELNPRERPPEYPIYQLERVGWNGSSVGIQVLLVEGDGVGRHQPTIVRFVGET